MFGERGDRFRWVCNHTDAVLAVSVVGLVLLLLVPIRPILLDTFLCINIILSVMVLLLTLYVENSLDFSSFPSVLLFLTLFRLGLNIASTRMILSRAEAGDLIHTFGDFVIQGNLFVGFVLFCLVSMINFIVVTKGAGRIAEVTARFTLEALPGRQIAIDSELSSGLITQEQAKSDRKKLRAETDFYGSMDGASKFVKGDAIAGLLITGVNIIGGLITGILLKGMNIGECLQTITCLTIGDGLVSQIPALLVSIGAATMVTRSSADSLGKTVPKQLLHQPMVLVVTGFGILGLSIVPGMPRFVMIPLSLLLIYLGYRQEKKSQKGKDTQREAPSLFVAPVEILMGYQVVLLAEPLKEKLSDVREQVAAHLGICMPAVRISDHSELSPTGWAILIKGVKVAYGRDPDLASLVQKLIEVIESRAHELINRQVVSQMLHQIKHENSAVVEEILGKKVSTGQILKILKNLLKERVPIRDFATILELVADHAKGDGIDIDLLSEEVRKGLRRKISEEFFGKSHRAYIITLDPKVEQMLAVAKTGLRPKIIDQLCRNIMQIHEKAKEQGIRPVVVTTVTTRLDLKKIIENHLPDLPVLSYKEISPDIELHRVGNVTNEVFI